MTSTPATSAWCSAGLDTKQKPEAHKQIDCDNARPVFSQTPVKLFSVISQTSGRNLIRINVKYSAVDTCDITVYIHMYQYLTESRIKLVIGVL